MPEHSWAEADHSEIRGRRAAERVCGSPGGGDGRSANSATSRSSDAASCSSTGRPAVDLRMSRKRKKYGGFCEREPG